MGIAFRDLSAGALYKGYHQPAPTGLKCFYFVTQIRMLAGFVEAEVTFALRHQSTTTWSPLFTVSGKADDGSLLKQHVSLATVQSEGVGPPPSYHNYVAQPSVSPPVPAVSGPSSLGSSASQEASDLAKAERNRGKVVIPENAYSPKCVKCHGANRAVALFQFTSYYCERCEPT